MDVEHELVEMNAIFFAERQAGVKPIDKVGFAAPGAAPDINSAYGFRFVQQGSQKTLPVPMGQQFVIHPLQVRDQLTLWLVAL